MTAPDRGHDLRLLIQLSWIGNGLVAADYPAVKADMPPATGD